MAMDPRDVPAPVLAFLTERHLATLTTVRDDGTPHVVPVGFTFDVATATARVITSAGSVKARNVRGSGRVALCQVDRGRWVTLEGTAEVHDAPDVVADAERRYAERYQVPRPNDSRVALVVAVDRVLGRVNG
jgi:PPOX class probable F420-dependent enzyme